MVEFVEHRKGASDHGQGSEAPRKIMQCAIVVQWQEPDGTEYVTVAGDAELTDLGIKGMLHDGIYAMAHQGEPGYKQVNGA
jgi:hypothetical protein